MVNVRCVSLVLVIGLLAASVGGCDERPQTSPTQPAQPPSSALIYRRTGGFAGHDDRIVIWPDDYAQWSGRFDHGGRALTADEAKVVRAVQDAWPDIVKWASDREWDNSVADVFEITISFAGETIQFQDTGNVPPAVTELLKMLDGLVQETLVAPPSKP